MEQLFQEVANSVTDKDFKVGRLYPRLNRIRELSVKIAIAVGEHAYKVCRYYQDFPFFNMLMVSIFLK